MEKILAPDRYIIGALVQVTIYTGLMAADISKSHPSFSILIMLSLQLLVASGAAFQVSKNSEFVFLVTETNEMVSAKTCARVLSPREIPQLFHHFYYVQIEFYRPIY